MDLPTDKRVLVVKPEFTSDCEFDVYIDGEKHQPQEGELYRFTTDCKEHGGKKIKIVVHKGKMLIDKHHSVGHYPLLFMGKWTTIEIPQEKYIHWMGGLDLFPEVLKAGDKLEYNHLYPNGVSYIEFHVDYDDMKPISKNIRKNTASVMRNIK